MSARGLAHSVMLPMDGYHLANAELARLGRAARKGAEDTFDSAGYVHLLSRLREQQAGEIVYAPQFLREIEEGHCRQHRHCPRDRSSSSPKAITCCSIAATGRACVRC
jgi:pantothenate kinase